MTMPTWDQTYHPILHELADGRLKDAKSIRAAVIAAFAMTVDEQNEMLKSGQPRIANRVGWGLTDLYKAQLVEKGNKRGTYRITDAGREFLQQHEDAITLADLKTVPAFLAWRQGYQSKTIGAKERSTALQADISEQSDEATPEDLMETASEQLNEALASELLDRIMDNDPYFFERLVTRLVLSLGYGDLSKTSGEVTKKSGDGGIDGVVRLDRLGLDSVYIQAKRWNTEHVVGRPDIQGFVGALVGNGANKGVFITTSRFSEEARRYGDERMRSSDISVVLIDGLTLAKLMIEYNVGVGVKTVYEIKAIDNDFFDAE
ncbi:restriction endonuclease [Bifidobacterium myosotis]|uniref:Restriction endonuclease n=1 Tax=Bifidobacterium myosotis TaxID=1630166 RepID=A0A5M9ZI76_9BIFI|nr:restriction endonuclease [Bifidobacterium myosotis]KAA8825811.1 restriction endonuclease [Bifidobacterium myosotis]